MSRTAGWMILVASVIAISHVMAMASDLVAAAASPAQLKAPLALLELQSRTAHRVGQEAALSDELLEALAAQVSEEMLMGYIESLVAFGTRHTCRPGHYEAAEWLFEELSSFGLPVRFEDHWLSGRLIRNVVATLWGSVDPTRIVVLSGNYDSIVRPPELNAYMDAPGAIGNGTGNAITLEAARLLSQYAPAFTIEFVFFSAEEQGMYGSQFFVDRALAEGRHVTADINLDVMGYDPNNDMKVKLEANRSSEWMFPYAWRAMEFTPLSSIEVTESSEMLLWAQADHSSFWYRGVPALYIHEGIFPDNPYPDTADDTIDHITVPYFVETAKLVILTTALLAFNQLDAPKLELYSDRQNYGTDSRIDLDIAYANRGQPTTLSFYLVLITPDERALYYPLWGPEPEGIRVNLPGNYCSERMRLCSFDVPSSSPPIALPGPYKFAACLAASDGTIASNVAVASFTVEETSHCPAGMVGIPTGRNVDYWGHQRLVFEFCIDRFEYPNVEGEGPVHTVSWLEAWSYCIDQGKYLCSKDEWVRACKGPDYLMFPYGNSYDFGACNTEGLEVVASGAFDRCVSGFGVHDMSGNVFEWTSSDQWGNLLFGGFYKAKEFEASCDFGFIPLPTERFARTPFAGLRCCWR